MFKRNGLQTTTFAEIFPPELKLLNPGIPKFCQMENDRAQGHGELSKLLENNLLERDMVAFCCRFHFVFFLYHFFKVIKQAGLGTNVDYIMCSE